MNVLWKIHENGWRTIVVTNQMSTFTDKSFIYSSVLFNWMKSKFSMLFDIFLSLFIHFLFVFNFFCIAASLNLVMELMTPLFTLPFCTSCFFSYSASIKISVLMLCWYVFYQFFFLLFFRFVSFTVSVDYLVNELLSEIVVCVRAEQTEWNWTGRRRRFCNSIKKQFKANLKKVVRLVQKKTTMFFYEAWTRIVS